MIPMEGNTIEANNWGEINKPVENVHEFLNPNIQKSNKVVVAVQHTCQGQQVAAASSTIQETHDADGVTPIFNLVSVSSEKRACKEHRQLDKRQVADEKKRQREEEHRRKLVPRDQKVTLVDQKLLDLVDTFSTRLSVAPRRCRDTSSSLAADDFPKLGAGCSKQGDTGARLGPAASSEAGCGGKPADSTRPSRRQHWRGALRVELADIVKSKSTVKQGGGVGGKPLSRFRYDGKPTLCGNPLDSSNPERKRGKFREKKKLKVSSLKRIIHSELERKRREKTGLAEGYDFLDVVNNNDVGLAAIRHDTERRDHSLVLHVNKVHEDPVVGSQSQTFQDTLQLAGMIDAASILSDCGPEAQCCETSSSAEKAVLERLPLTAAGASTSAGAKVLHSRKFREYCDHFVTPEIIALTSKLVCELLRLQDRQYKREPIKARGKRKYVVGLHEASKYLALRKLKLLIIATDIDKIESAGGLNDIVGQLKEKAAAQNVPCVFALQRRKLGYITLKKRPVSCVGVLNYQACEVLVDELMDTVATARQQYGSARQECEISCKQVRDLLEPTDTAAAGRPRCDADGAVEEIISSFISLVRSKSATECTIGSSSFLQAIDRSGKS